MFDAGSETVVEVVEGDSLAISCYARGQRWKWDFLFHSSK